jgi:hypothetical protein
VSNTSRSGGSGRKGSRGSTYSDPRPKRLCGSIGGRIEKPYQRGYTHSGSLLAWSSVLDRRCVTGLEAGG